MERGNQSREVRRGFLSEEFLDCLRISIFSCRISVNQFKRVATSLAYFGVHAKIRLANATTIPYARIALRPLRLCTKDVSLVAHKHSYHNGSTATIPAAASTPSFAIVYNYECAEGVTLPGLGAFATISMIASVREKSTFESDYLSGVLLFYVQY